MFPPSDPIGTAIGNSSALPLHLQSYSLSFRESEADSRTKAVFRITDSSTITALRACCGIDLRIERHGDLTTSPPGLSLEKIQPPLYRFQLQPSLSPKSTEGMEFDLPEKLDLGVSETGIIGRKVTAVARGVAGELIQMGNGIVGYD
ncbi:hypothetical protein BDW59DRAFT_163362 [Aspergillus cavernicola]|uniref:Uncharacterized protein n=1 Tax=Aspergillus cavernicola TaxID=176166 RepID=A0ABR4I6X2_9EURO